VPITRRHLVWTALAAPAAGLALSPRPAAAQSAVAAEILTPGTLPDMVLGKPDATIAIVEYSSMTCPHCQNFHLTVLPHLKKTYLDTGKARLIFREFPLDQLAMAVAMIARAAPADTYFDVVELYFERLNVWARSDRPLDAIRNVAKQIGFTDDSFKAALTDQKLLDGITEIRTRASDRFKVNATPSFFINGKKVEEFYSPELVDQTLKPYL
jgi:protein-disulfide isomerase